MRYYLLYVILISLFLLSCTDSGTEPNETTPLDVEIRMEVQILDSTYQLYTRPFTKIYFTTFKLSKLNDKSDFDQSDTTSCRNGWGVKILNYRLMNEEERIVLGAACESYDGNNYREIIIEYKEAERRIDSTGVSNIIKTFAIYYK